MESEPDLVRQWNTAREASVLLDGFHAIKHAMRFGAEVMIMVSADPAQLDRLAADLAPDVAAAMAAAARPVSDEALGRLVARPHPTKMAALAKRPSGGVAAGSAGPIVVLDDPRHLGNVGAVVRVAAGFGIGGVVTIGDLDPWHPTVVRAAAGLHFATTVDRSTTGAPPSGPMFALDPEGRDLRDVTIPDDAVLVFGSERRGVSDVLRRSADEVVSLPMRPLVSSYNLATSVAMTLFAWSQNRPERLRGVAG
ncbi:tRNA G18 (ribose-2'-O)-methylase SpoU [Stackebrandtia endophytica]|uniref:tRNA G18 (Ribose-2'-O)-methylase SpoU n=1 Tax=Stackebrandtia endophytica TaxID=1496996 RepID=A0A543AU90_9ACTN|nr:TrmH family RNA methyltransferase [Stackebrandtia endophytica]TQL76116.1 tRNA G18 (ribose-2'-O)-methylase SpoU [Stackebrandtia endophytica]